MYLVLQLRVFCAHFKNLGLSETPKPSTLKCYSLKQPSQSQKLNFSHTLECLPGVITLRGLPSSETHTLRGSSKS